jgi:hypothetical protein
VPAPIGRVLLPTVGLHDISSLLLTTHKDKDDGRKDVAVPVSEDERNQFLADNKATIDVIVEQANLDQVTYNGRLW